jgi:hypothetical protein
MRALVSRVVRLDGVAAVSVRGPHVAVSGDVGALCANVLCAHV